jgi:magnesium transporter
MTLLASVFGMNVAFPGAGSPLAFWLIMGSMLAILLGMVAFFRSRGWL